MKVFDVFPFFNEFEILNIRIRELWDVVDEFVIIEAPYTFMMNKKEYLLSEEIEGNSKWQEFLPKLSIWKIPVEDYSTIKVQNPWNVERFQRNYIAKYLKQQCQADDVVIFSDVDEIPSAEAVKTFMRSGNSAVNFDTILCRYKLNLMFQHWQVCQFFRWRKMSEYINDFHSIRKTHCKGFPTMRKSGWHFSSIGDIEAVWEKVTNFSHAKEHKRSGKLDKVRVMERMKKGLHPFKDGRKPGKEIDIEELPWWVRENQQYYAEKGLL